MRSVVRSWFVVSVLITFCALTNPGMAAEPIPHAQDRPPNPPMTPAEAIKRMKLPTGFHAELVASEPDIVNPVAMTFDERGRIWITESLEYPRREAGRGRDRVKFLEDTDGDGKADRFTVFADGLNIPSGIAVGHGGVWVANSPDILFFQDTDGDGKADTKEVVVSGFGRSDTHELPNSLTWGPDGWLYGWNGVFNPSHVVHRGKTYDFTCAIFRIHPRTRAFELFCEGTSNPWGIAWNTEGEAFASACVIDHLWHLTETGYYHRQGGPYPPFTWKIDSIVDHKHQKAAYCGIHFFDSEAYPPEYRERLYMGNIHGNCINVDTLKRRGSTYRGEAAPDFLTANDAWFMPVVQKTGPDGCLYILDWYDRYHCYQDANRDPAGIDRLKGRLYRIRYEQAPRAKPEDRSRRDLAGLLALAQSANVYDRDIAQRLLTERLQNSPAPDAVKTIESFIMDESHARKSRMHALWARIGGGSLEPKFHLALLEHKDAAYRAWGVRAAGNQRTVDSSVSNKVSELAHDPDPSVVLQVAIAAGKIESMQPFPVWFVILAHSGDDPLIPHIVWQNLHPMLGPEGDVFAQQITPARLKESPALVGLMPRVMERLLARKHSDPAAVTTLLKTLIGVGTGDTTDSSQKALDALFRLIMADELAGPKLAQLRAELQGPLNAIVKGNPDSPLYFDSALVASAWQDPEALAALKAALDRGKLPDPRRLQVFNALIGARDRETLDRVARVLENQSASSADFRGQLLGALGELDDPKVADIVLAQFPKLEPTVQPRAVELLTERTSWSLVLLKAIGEGKVPASALNLNQVRKLLASKDPAVVQQVKARWGTVREGRNPQREQIISQMRTNFRGQPGDAAAGQQVFKRVCGQCHKLFGEGQDVGPDITNNGRGSYEQLLSNVFDPSLVIGASYQATTVATKDGRVLTGLLVEDNDQRVVLKGQGGKLETLANKDIEERKIGALSLMPEDLEKQLKPQELVDLFKYLTLDKPPTDKSARPIPGAEELHRR